MIGRHIEIALRIFRKTDRLRTSTSGTETLLPAFPQPRNVKPLDGKTNMKNVA